MLRPVHRIAQQPITFLSKKLSQRQFLIFSSILVGLTSGLAAVLLKYFVHGISGYVSFYGITYQDFFLFAIFPLVGILLTVVFMRYVLRDDVHKGSAEIVYSITKKSSVIKAREMYSHLVTSGLTVGFGGSVGLESPMVSTGAAIGSNYGQSYNRTYKDRTILLACGASAGIAAAFNAPIAGVLFAVEVLLADVSASAFIPLIVSAASGALLSKMMLQEGATLSFSLQEPFNYYNVPYYILLGILAGFVSLYYTKVFSWVEHRFVEIRNQWKRALIGGLVMFVLILLFPPLFGEGYATITNLANLHPERLIENTILKPLINNEGILLVFLGLLVFAKAIAAGVTLASGGNGGNFGPSLFVGAYLGFVLARVLKMLGLTSISESNLTIVAMAGILSGVFYAPLTAIFLIAEITGGYELMIPLMIVSSLSLIIAHLFEPLSMDAKKLSAKHNLSVSSRDHFLLSKLDLTSLIETNFSHVHPEESLQMLIKTVSSSIRNQFPVVDATDTLLGVVHMDNIRKMIFNPGDYQEITVKDVMVKPAAVIEVNESLHSVLHKFEETKQWNLPVTEKGKYVGFVSKSSILSRYRSEMIQSV